MCSYVSNLICFQLHHIYWWQLTTTSIEWIWMGIDFSESLHLLIHTDWTLTTGTTVQMVDTWGVVPDHAFSCTVSWRAGGQSISQAASILFVIHVPGKVQYKMEIMIGHHPLSVYPLSTLRNHTCITKSARPSPPYLHTASDQRLEVGTAWEWGLYFQ